MWVLDVRLFRGISSYIVNVLQVKMGRDHTIYAVSPGVVRFYKEKWLSGERRFVGVVLERGEKLPRDEATLGRSRYCGLVNLNSAARIK
jgi:large subunit ribosomal protein L27